MADHAFNLIVLLFASLPAFITCTAAQPGYCIKTTTSSAQYKKSFVCHFRGYVLITTAISILAVDFVVYPRRFAKTETFGTGLMDVAVGCFVISNALVCPEARFNSSPSLLKSLGKELKAVSILLGLGLARFLSVKSTDYQEHVSEYGVHWNFFLTVATVRISSAIILGILPQFLRKHCWLLGLVLGLSYHYILTHGLEHFVLHGSVGDGSRTNLIDANREGICSSLGYLALYFLGIGVGKLVFRKKDNNVNCSMELLLSLVAIAVLAWSVLFYWTSHVGMISRRLANFAFILWQIAFNVQLLAMFLLVEIFLTTTGYQDMFFLNPGGCIACCATIKKAESLTEQGNSQTPSNDRVETPTSAAQVKKQTVVHRGSRSVSTDRALAESLTERYTSPETPLNDRVETASSSSGHVKKQTVHPSSQAASTDQVSAENWQCRCLLSAVNFNQLGYFMIANLLTGAVNLSMETVHASPLTAFIILNIYLIALNSIIMVLYRYKFLLKF